MSLLKAIPPAARRAPATTVLTTAGTKDGYTITGTGGTFSWKVTYEGDTNTDGVQHRDTESCVEESTVTIDNDNTKP